MVQGLAHQTKKKIRMTQANNGVLLMCQSIFSSSSVSFFLSSIIPEHSFGLLGRRRREEENSTLNGPKVVAARQQQHLSGPILAS